jgi:hypothetical protein
MNLTEIVTQISNTRFEIRLLESGIIENVIKEGVHVERQDVQELKEMNQNLAGGEKYAVLISPHYLSTFSKEARELTASFDFAIDTVASAIIADNMGHRIVGEFYLQVNKPHINTKLFTNKDEAVDWLREQLQLTKKG